MVNESRIEDLLKSLFEVSEEFNLKINPTKSAIILVKNHNKLNGKICNIEI